MSDDEPPPNESEPASPPSHPVISALAILGTGLLAAGVFCPVVVLPSGATRSYYGLPWVDANIVLGAATAAFVLTWVFRWYRGLFVTGGLALFLLGTTLLKLSRSEFHDAALTWGWLPLSTGSLLLLTAAFWAEKIRPKHEIEEPEDPFEDYE